MDNTLTWAMPHRNARMIQLLHQAAIPGCAVALVHGRELVWSGSFGVRPGSGAPVQPTTLFQAASLTKPLCAMAVLALCDAGILDLDQPLSECYADPRVYHAAARAISARHVLSHTTGLPNWCEEESDSDALLPQSPPGRSFSYSGEAFEYLQRTLDHVLGMPFAQYVQQTLLTALGMHSSRMVWARDADGRDMVDADGIAAAEGPQQIASAAWSLLTTAEDYSRFLRAVLNPHDCLLGLLPAARTTMQTPQVRLTTHPALHWGLGWGLYHTAHGDGLWHWGGPQNGFTSYVSAIPAQQRGIVILTNSADGLPCCQQIAEAALGLPQPAFDWLLPVTAWNPRG